jgi:arylsulfatase A
MMTHRGMHVPLIVNWPAAMRGRGTVSQDLIDSTDILPTVCEAAGTKVPAELKIDGHSFLAQLRGEPGKPRDWYYSWYAPRNELVGEFAANQHYKLYRTGEFFDLAQDLDENRPLKVDSLSGEAAAAAKQLQSALDQYRDARPADLPKRTQSAKKKREAD